MAIARRPGRGSSGQGDLSAPPKRGRAGKRVTGSMSETDKRGFELSPPARTEEPGYRGVPGEGPNPTGRR